MVIFKSLNSIVSKRDTYPMTQSLYDITPAKIREYFKQNWGSSLIVVFMMLLLIASVSFAIGLSYWADLFSLYAYYALAAGVLLQIACVFVNRKRNKEAI